MQHKAAGPPNIKIRSTSKSAQHQFYEHAIFIAKFQEAPAYEQQPLAETGPSA
jgi:hypothetical protein